MKTILIDIKILFEIIRCFPHLILFFFHKNKKTIQSDTIRWLYCCKLDYGILIGFIYLLSFHREFRSLFYKRVGLLGHILNIFCPKMSNLFIATENIGEGLFIQHGYSTFIAAKSIGRNCWINQEVTIGYTATLECPILLDNVTISAGAKVLGKVIIGNNVIVGANAVVVKSVPDNCVVVGVPAYIIKRNGLKVNEML